MRLFRALSGYSASIEPWSSSRLVWGWARRSPEGEEARSLAALPQALSGL
jgi:hypothetical protein